MQEKLQELIFRLERMSADEVPKEWVLLKLKELVALPTIISASARQPPMSTFVVDTDDEDFPKEHLVDVIDPGNDTFCIMIPSSIGVGDVYTWQGRTYRLFSDGLHPIDTK